MNPGAYFGRFKDTMFRAYSGDGGKMLVHMGALGWLFSSAAQIVAILTDKKIDKSKRKFLLPQEGADAAVNVVMYYSLCAAIKKASDIAVERGYIMPGNVIDTLMSIKPASVAAVSKKNWKSLFNKEELKSLTKTFSSFNNMSMFKNAELGERLAARLKLVSMQREFKAFKNGMGVFAAIFASVLACNIVTPYVRNIVANKVKDKLNKKEAQDIRKKQIVSNLMTKNPLPASFSSFQKYNTFSNVKI
ncbi:MAG: hypothetical protein KHX03_01815 [Clostridium sp.]|nr:hypothetical protein [Clostridium sp.]